MKQITIILLHYINKLLFIGAHVITANCQRAQNPLIMNFLFQKTKFK